MLRSTLTAFTAFLAAATPVVAHPGHGSTTPDTVAHYVFEPIHALPVLVLLAVIGAAVMVRRRNRTR